ncbi:MULTISPECIES: hypothetical protein [Paenibacillus]|nr:hypothetical protein [Paenibacillus caseinilyticus]MCZ8521228.1 hypothetical protein [Paenibacillus caseinilyticus]
MKLEIETMGGEAVLRELDWSLAVFVAGSLWLEAAGRSWPQVVYCPPK